MTYDHFHQLDQILRSEKSMIQIYPKWLRRKFFNIEFHIELAELLAENYE